MSSNNQHIALFGRLAIAAAAYHALAMTLLHVLAPEVHPLRDMVGDYLTSSYPILARSTFLALGCALTFVACGLSSRLRSSAWARLATPLVILAAVGFAGVALAPHAAGLFAVTTQPATVGSLLLLSIALGKQGWQGAPSGLLIAISVLLVALFSATILFGLTASLGLAGLANRAVLILIYGWVALVGRGLLIKGPEVAREH